MITRIDSSFRLRRQERRSPMPNRDAIVQPGPTLICLLLPMTSTNSRSRIETERLGSPIAANARTNDNPNLNLLRKTKTNLPRVLKTRLQVTAPVTVIIISLRALQAKRHLRFRLTRSQMANVRRLSRVLGGCYVSFPVKAGISLAECSKWP